MRTKKSRPIKFKVESVSTKEEVDTYSTAGRYGEPHSAREGMNLVIDLRGTVDGKTAYLSKRIPFTRMVGMMNGDFYFLRSGGNENEWGRIVKVDGKVVKSATPEIFPDAVAIVHEERFEVKIKAGDTLSMVAIVEEKVSKTGRAYLAIKRAIVADEEGT